MRLLSCCVRLKIFPKFPRLASGCCLVSWPVSLVGLSLVVVLFPSVASSQHVVTFGTGVSGGVVGNDIVASFTISESSGYGTPTVFIPGEQFPLPHVMTGWPPMPGQINGHTHHSDGYPKSVDIYVKISDLPSSGISAVRFKFDRGGGLETETPLYSFEPDESGNVDSCICQHLESIDDELFNASQRLAGIRSGVYSSRDSLLAIRSLLEDGPTGAKGSAFVTGNQSVFKTFESESVFLDGDSLSAFVDLDYESAFLNTDRESVFKANDGYSAFIDQDGNSVFKNEDGDSLFAGSKEFRRYLMSEPPEVEYGEPDPEPEDPGQLQGELKTTIVGMGQPWDPAATGYGNPGGYGSLANPDVRFDIPGLGQRTYNVNLTPSQGWWDANVSPYFYFDGYRSAMRTFLTGCYVFWLGFKAWDKIT